MKSEKMIERLKENNRDIYEKWIESTKLPRKKKKEVRKLLEFEYSLNYAFMKFINKSYETILMI